MESRLVVAQELGVGEKDWLLMDTELRKPLRVYVGKRHDHIDMNVKQSGWIWKVLGVETIESGWMDTQGQRRVKH